MSQKPVVLIYDINNAVVDETAAIIGRTGLYTSINTYNETNALEAMAQYNRGLSLLTNRLSCIITGWNRHRKPRDQFLFHVRSREGRSPLRKPTPVIIVTEDHRLDLKRMALDPTDGNAAAYLDVETFQSELPLILQKVAFEDKAHELNAVAFAQVQRESD